MTHDEIRAAIAASPELQALGQDTQAIADALSVGRTRVQPRMTSARGLAELMPGGPLAAEVVLMKLEGARDALQVSEDADERVMGSLLRRQLAFLSGEGLDFGSAALRSMLTQFGQLGILTADEVAALLTIGVVPDPVSAVEVSYAMLPTVATWTGTLESVTLENGMVYATIKYTSENDAVKVERAWADTLTPSAVAQIIKSRVESLTKADAALAMFG